MLERERFLAQLITYDVKAIEELDLVRPTSTQCPSHSFKELRARSKLRLSLG